MRTTRMLLLSFLFLMLASDVVVDASMDDSMKLFTCVDKILPSTKPCNRKTCENECVKRTRQAKESECTPDGCMCRLCIKPAPTIYDNEQMGTN
ncbi:hypothetical protein ZWY2020_023452 [Hordeum vulgare]|nr:hypothetical protein ZWY2020_023452 [Hordeum vulgare]